MALPAEVVEIAETLEQAGFETWCVGGAIRDSLLGHPKSDIDLATQATPEEVQRLFRRTVPVGVKFGTVGVFDRANHLHEVTTFRKDVSTDGRHAVVEYGASLDDDLARRDFTINAIAYHPLHHEWRDPFEGTGDLGRGLVKAVGDPAARFREDYLRILRAIRFAARLEFVIDAPTWAAAQAAAPGLGQLSAERVREEWFGGLETTKSLARLTRLWHEVGAAAIWLPGLAPGFPLKDDAPEIRDPIRLHAALVANPAESLRVLKASTAEIDRVARLAAGPPGPASAADVEVRRWLAKVEPFADDLERLHWLRTGELAPWAEAVAGVRARGEAFERSGLKVTGDDLRAAGIGPGPEIGRVLAALLEAVIGDPALNERAILLERAREMR